MFSSLLLILFKASYNCNYCISILCFRSRSNAKRSLQSCINTSASVRYENIQQSLPGVYSPYATLTVANDCQTYNDLMPTEITYENTTTMATHYNESTQDKTRKTRRKKKTKRWFYQIGYVLCLNGSDQKMVLFQEYSHPKISIIICWNPHTFCYFQIQLI